MAVCLNARGVQGNGVSRYVRNRKRSLGHPFSQRGQRYFGNTPGANEALRVGNGRVHTRRRGERQLNSDLFGDEDAGWIQLFRQLARDRYLWLDSQRALHRLGYGEVQRQASLVPVRSGVANDQVPRMALESEVGKDACD